MATYAEVQAHLGVGYGTLTEAHLGIWFEETSIVVVEPTTKKTRDQGRVYTTGSGGTGVTPLYPWPLDEHAVMRAAAQQAHDLALDPKLQSWVSGLLSTSPKPITSDADVADVILTGVQEHIAEPLVRVVQLGAAFSAVGLPTYLVTHGNGTTWPTTAVFLDGAWYYANPDLTLGTHKKFEREHFYKIPDLPLPEVAALRAEVQELKLRVQQLELALQQVQTPQIVFNIDLGEEERARAEFYRTLLVIGALGGAVALIWWAIRRNDTIN